MQQPTVQPKKSKYHFTPEEDQIIRDAVKSGDFKKQTKSGKPDWKAITALLPGRTLRQVRARWLHYLQNGTSAGPWTPEEDTELLKRYDELGAKWSKIALHLPGRSDLQVRNRWLLLQHHQQNPDRKLKTEPSIHITPEQSSRIAQLILENKSIAEIATEIYGSDCSHNNNMRIRMHILYPTFAQILQQVNSFTQPTPPLLPPLTQDYETILESDDLNILFPPDPNWDINCFF